MPNSLPTPLELIKNLIVDFERIELHERDKERLTQIASALHDLRNEVNQRNAAEKAQAK
ncbi:MAG: hypothetical protein HYX67_12710 [Candidatus Melainabacteria bacterium]|nr:hypothetical protein [Candidatus Melainabacteria bacterium]